MYSFIEPIFVYKLVAIKFTTMAAQDICCPSSISFQIAAFLAGHDSGIAFDMLKYFLLHHHDTEDSLVLFYLNGKIECIYLHKMAQAEPLMIKAA
jgi:hypothetical protein